MKNATVIDTDRCIRKDKRREQNLALPPEEASHLRDALDIVVYGSLSALIIEDSISSGDISAM